MPRRVVPPHTYGTPSSVIAYRAIRTFAVGAGAGSGVNIMFAVLSALSGRIGASHVAGQVTEIQPGAVNAPVIGSRAWRRRGPTSSACLTTCTSAPGAG